MLEQLRAQRCLGAPDGVQELRPGRRGRGHDVERRVPPVARHLAAAGRGIGRGADRLVEHLGRRDAQLRGRARGRGSTGRTSRTLARSTIPAAQSTASCPAPEIWKKILFWRLSWISLSSSRRDRSMVRYAPTSWSRDSPAALLRSARV